MLQSMFQSTGSRIPPLVFGATMSIAAICQPEVIMIDAGASLRDAANSMRAHHVGPRVVTEPIRNVQ